MITVIIQARMQSSRLPGKVLLNLRGAPVIAHVIARAQAIPGIDQVCCAIPQGPADDRLAANVEELGATLCRGSETDVLDRYLTAARACEATVVMRVTADCPLLDPAVSGYVLADFLAYRPDYASNVDPRSWPRGLDTEVFSREALERAARHSLRSDDREHVTPWLRRNSATVRRNVALEGRSYGDWRWTLDYKEDLDMLRALLEPCPPFPYLPGFAELRTIFEDTPNLAAINARRT